MAVPSQGARLLLVLAAVACGCNASPLAPELDEQRWSINTPAILAPTPPRFPAAFEAQYMFSLPYVKVVQTRGLRFPVHVWFDANKDRLRVDVYKGLDSTITVKDTTYLVYPRIDETVCDEFNDDVGPTAANAMLLGAAPLPDITTGWRYAGNTILHNKPANIWQMSKRVQEKVSTYTFYTSPKEGLPMRLYMMGFNIMAGSHYDEYLIDFISFKAGPISDSAFTIPRNCKPLRPTLAATSAAATSAAANQAGTAQADTAAAATGAAVNQAAGDTAAATDAAAGALDAATSALDAARARAAQAAAVMPWGHLHTSQPLDATAGDTNAEAAENLLAVARRGAAARTAQLVGSWDAAAAGYSLAVNKFADWLPEEYARLATARRSTPATKASKAKSLGVVKRMLTRTELPKHVDWRGTSAELGVKDQATCGSCWAFAATGTMEAAWYMATGQTISLSEQQLVDCSWNLGNNGCGGGEMDAAIQHVADSDLGGLMSEESYQYLGQNAFCGQNATRRDEPPTARFQGFADIKKRDNEALMEAVYKHGPVAVSIDAAHESFRFYSEGVFTSKDCKIDPDDMDHAVLLVGYGTTEDGQDYWLIRNSWSTYWGESGYIRMARSSGNGEGTEDCGVTTDPVIAVVDPKYYKPAVPARVLFEPKAGASAAPAAAAEAVAMQQ